MIKPREAMQTPYLNVCMSQNQQKRVIARRKNETNPWLVDESVFFVHDQHMAMGQNEQIKP